MKKMVRCSNGHFYDADRYTSCPECEAERRKGGFGGGATESVRQDGFGGFERYGATEPVRDGGFSGGFAGGATEPVRDGGFSGGFAGGATEPVRDGGFSGGFAGGATEPVRDGGFNGSFGGPFNETIPPTTPIPEGATRPGGSWDIPMGQDGGGSVTVAAPIGGIVGFSPVVGWLVCIEGPDRGNDYRIRAGYNYIGRAEKMDICVRGDEQISREKAALIFYDDLKKSFRISSSEGRTIIRVNDDDALMTPTRLNPYDTVTIGATKLIFVPLCGEQFDWNKQVSDKAE